MHEAINTQTCPLCGGMHTYKLAVETRKDPDTAALPLRKRRRRFEGAFLCPVQNKPFKGSATLLLPSGEHFTSVKVEEVHA